MEKRKRGLRKSGSSAATTKRSKARDVANRENRGCQHRCAAKKELSLCMNSAALRDAQEPLRVILPPAKGDSNQLKEHNVFTIDKEENMEKTPLSDSDNVNVDNTTGISVEEFECGVSVEGSDKQEWSFTLYDFDGRGKITKEDLASLMKSLYDAVGSSIKLPQGGTKTLKLRLTVSPDATKVTQQEGDKKLQEKQENGHHSNRSGKEGHRDSNLKQNNINQTQHSPSSPVSPRLDGKGNITPMPSPGKPRLSMVEQKQLAELVQKNMERHHRQQLQLRRHHSDHPQSGEVRHRRHHTHHHQRSRPSQECQDRRNYYLDLAGVENYNTTALLNTSAPAAVLETPDSKTVEPRTKSKNRSSRVEMLIDSHTSAHQRSKSHDLTNKVVFDDLASPERFAKLLEATNAQDSKLTSTPSKLHKSKHRPVSLPVPEEVSPHHHRRHRNRERNRSLAMKQVAEWIDREHLHEQEDEKVMIQRHEHHHIHEHHHHHHYHHYHET